MQSLPKTVKKEIIDDKPVHENDSEPLKVSTTMHGKVCVKLALQEGYNTHGLQLIPNAFAADEHVDAIEANVSFFQIIIYLSSIQFFVDVTAWRRCFC